VHPLHANQQRVWQAQQRSTHGDENRASIDDARTNAWLAICRLASETANNEAAADENRPDKMADTDPLWAVAIDRVPGVGGSSSIEGSYFPVSRPII
jgi:hypothetical protein